MRTCEFVASFQSSFGSYVTAPLLTHRLNNKLQAMGCGVVWCGVERRGGGEEHVWWVRAENEMNLCERNTAQLWEAVFTSWRSSLTEPPCLKFFAQ